MGPHRKSPISASRQPTRIFLMNSTLKNNPSARSRDEFLSDLILLSLLYDEVLVSDNDLLSSRHIATWFSGEEKFRLLEALIDVGALRVLKRPLEAYPDETQRTLAWKIREG